MWYVRVIYTMRFPNIFIIGKFVIYISCTRGILPLHPNYIWVFIDMVVNHTMLSALIYLHVLHNLIVSCASYWVFCSISLRCMGYSTIASSLHLRLYWYVCECYIYVFCNILVCFIRYTHWIYSILVGLSFISHVYDF